MVKSIKIANSPRTPHVITELAKILNRAINKNLRPDERDLPLRHRLWLWHLFRVQHDLGPIFWCLAWIWWIPGFRWLWQLRCRNVSFRMEAHNRRVMRKTKVVLYDWSGAAR